MHAEIQIVGPIVPVPSPALVEEEPDLLPVEGGDPAASSSSGTLDMKALASLGAPEGGEPQSMAGPDLDPGLELPRFSGIALAEAPVEITGPVVESPTVGPEPRPSAPRGTDTVLRRGLPWVMAAMGSVLAVLLLVN